VSGLRQLCVKTFLFNCKFTLKREGLTHGDTITRDLESHVTAGLVEKLGAGLHLNRHPGANLAMCLARVIEQPTFLKAAKQFASTHQGHDPAQLSIKILDSLSEILAAHSPTKRIPKRIVASVRANA
jgi:hypothetical protein